MEAPKCKLCEKRHYGSCGDAVIPAEPRVRKSKKSGAKTVRQQEQSLVDRVDELEHIVVGLMEGRRKRSAYMKDYMRDFRRRAK